MKNSLAFAVRAVPAFVVAMACLSGAARAADINRLQNLGSQSAFRGLTEDLGAALSYKSLSPATPLGITGFDIGVDASATRMKSDAFKVATGSSNATLPLARLRAQKGLPFGFDVGLSYAAAPGTNVRLWGGEARYAIAEGGLIAPAIALRGSFSRLDGVSQLDFNTRAVDLSISKGFLGVTPYGGVGHVWATGKPNGIAGLSQQSVGLNKSFVGVNFGLGLFATGVEYDRTGSADTLSVKLALRW
jgi:hypothetical protein